MIPIIPSFKRTAYSGPKKMPESPNSFTPAYTENSITTGYIPACLPRSFGSRYSLTITQPAYTAAIISTFPVFPRISCHTAIGKSTSPVPIKGSASKTPAAIPIQIPFLIPAAKSPAAAISEIAVRIAACALK